MRLFVVLLLLGASLGGALTGDSSGENDYEILEAVEKDFSEVEGNSAYNNLNWYNSNWSFRREVTVSTVDPLQSDYQVVVTLTTSKMGSPYEHVNANGSDLRFTDTDGAAELSYWIQSWDNTGESTIWVKLAGPVNGSSSKTIYMYYGNSDASPASDPTATFHIYDDFSDGNVNGWTNEGGGNPYHDSGRLAWYSDGYPQVCYYSGAQMDRNQRLEALINPAEIYVGQGFLIQDQNNHYNSRGTGNWRLNKIEGGSFSTLSTGTEMTNSNYRYDAWFSGNTIYASINEDTVAGSDGTWSSGYVGLSSWSSNSGTHYMDWVRVREYTANEPTTSVSDQVEPTLTVKIPTAVRGEVAVSWNGEQETVTDERTFVIGEGTQVDLEALPADLHEFSHWAGDHSGTNKNTTVAIDGNKEISANFDTVPIEDWYELDKVRGFLESDAYFSLGADLDEDTAGYNELVDNEQGWEPIGNETDPFSGAFDGNGHEIRDLWIDRSGEDNVGLFGYLDSGAQITKVGVSNANVSGGDNVGLLVGYTYQGLVNNSYATGNVSGGIRIGGLVGYTHNDASVNNSYAITNVTGNERIGGLLGQNYGTVENSYAAGPVSGSGDVGGLVGFTWVGTVENSFWDTETSGVDTSDGGTGKNTSEMKDVATYTDTATEGLQEPWDFVGDPYDDTSNEDTWDIDEFEVMNDGYPFLSWQEFLGVAVEAPADSSESSSGIYNYSFGVNNTGNIADTYDLGVETSDPDWTADVTADVTVSGGDMEGVDVNVTIPGDAGGKSCEVTLTAESQSDPAVTYSDSMIVSLEENLGVVVQAPADRSESSSGTYTYSYSVENTGNTEDTYNIGAEADQNGWSAESVQDEITVGVGETLSVDVEVVIPGDGGGETSTVTLTAESQSDNSISDSDYMQVTLELDIGVSVTAPKDHSENSTSTHTYTYEVENTGNTEETYDLSGSADQTGWSASSQSSVTVLPGDLEEVNVDVEIPENADDGENSEIILTAESQTNPGVSDSDSMIVNYNEDEIRKVVVNSPSDVMENESGTSTHSFEVHNTGNVNDTYDISVYETGWETDAPNEISVNEGDTELVDVDVTIPESAEDGDSIEVILTAESQEDNEVSDSDPMNITFSPEMVAYELTIDAGEGGTTEPSAGTHTYQEGTEVIVEAIPDEGWYFDGWSGDRESRDKEISITMDSDKELIAHFEEIEENER
ncbi:MAG: DUF2341 domain-containing protein, partial [Candidatus Thermoplasmatota archaeon]